MLRIFNITVFIFVLVFSNFNTVDVFSQNTIDNNSSVSQNTIDNNSSVIVNHNNNYDIVPTISNSINSDNGNGLIEGEYISDYEKHNDRTKFFYIKAFGAMSFASKNNIVGNTKIVENKKAAMNGVGLAIGANIGLGENERIFLSLEASGLYAIKGIGLNISGIADGVDANSLPELSLRGFFVYSPRFGVNLFNKHVSLYIKPNIGWGFYLKNNGKSKGRPMFGVGAGIDFNVSKYILITLECNYNILKYGYTVKDKTPTKTIYTFIPVASYKMLILNLGIGFRF